MFVCDIVNECVFLGLRGFECFGHIANCVLYLILSLTLRL